MCPDLFSKFSTVHCYLLCRSLICLTIFLNLEPWLGFRTNIIGMLSTWTSGDWKASESTTFWSLILTSPEWQLLNLFFSFQCNYLAESRNLLPTNESYYLEKSLSFILKRFIWEKACFICGRKDWYTRSLSDSWKVLMCCPLHFISIKMCKCHFYMDLCSWRFPCLTKC